MSPSLKIVIPMAGLGTRLRPHTWSKPKPLLQIAGKTVLDYVLDQFQTLPNLAEAEFVFIVGAQGDQIRAYMEQHHPDKKSHYVLQEQMRGQSDAIYLAHELLDGPMIMTFSDTLIESDLSFLKNENTDGVAFVKPVPDPRRFGVAEMSSEGWVTRLIEKPQEMNNNLALVGFYYFRSGPMLCAAIEEQMKRGVMLKNEYFLADAINILLEKGARMRVKKIDTWLDAGTSEALLETNSYLLHHRSDNSAEVGDLSGVTILPPVFIHPSATVKNAVIGPNVSIGADCTLENVIVRNSIIEDATHVSDMILSDSLLGSHARLEGQASQVNLGDNAWLIK